MEASVVTADSLPVAFEFGGVAVTRNADKMVNLTQMWEAAGKPANQSPAEWKVTASARKFINHIRLAYDSTNNGVIRSDRGKGKSTWAHWQVALAYAKYLSPEFHAYVNVAFREWIDEKADPSLKIERGVEAYRERGYTQEWISTRVEGIVTRKALTATMADHNCRVNGPNDNPFAEGTRAISLAVLGQTPREIKSDKGLAKSARTRDHLDEYELVRLRFAESEAQRLIKQTAADGNRPCVDCCRKAGDAVKVALQALQSA
jgi:hypothetical protein